MSEYANPRYAKSIKGEVISRYLAIDNWMATADVQVALIMSTRFMVDLTPADIALKTAGALMGRLIRDFLEPDDRKSIMSLGQALTLASLEQKVSLPVNIDHGPKNYILAKAGLVTYHRALNLHMDSLREILRKKNWLSEDFQYTKHVPGKDMKEKEREWKEEREKELNTTNVEPSH